MKSSKALEISFNSNTPPYVELNWNYFNSIGLVRKYNDITYYFKEIHVRLWYKYLLTVCMSWLGQLLFFMKNADIFSLQKV